jgi:hypothetical protein
VQPLAEQDKRGENKQCGRSSATTWHLQQLR